MPVFADVDPVTGNLDPVSVARRITRRTRAILAVHLIGAPAPAPVELRELAERRGVPLLEDCAQAWLARYPDGRLAGTAGAASCFSLQQWKHITCGDGGLVVTEDLELARRIRLFADKGWPRIDSTLLVLDWNEQYTEAHVDAIAQAVTAVHAAQSGQR